MTTYEERRAVTLEEERDAIAAGWSRTAQQRVRLVEHLAQLQIRFEVQGGRGFKDWLRAATVPDSGERVFSYGTVYNILDGITAVRHGVTASGVSELAAIGRQLRKGHTVEEALRLVSEGKRKAEAAGDAGINVSSIPTPSEAVGEVAEALVRVKRAFELSNLTPPPTEELTLTALRIINRHTPEELGAFIRSAEGAGRAPLQQPGTLTPLSMAAWLAARSPRVCQYPGCGSPATELHHVPLPDLQKRSDVLADHNLLDLCLRHHQSGGVSAAHGTAGLEGWARDGWGGYDRLLAFLYTQHVRWTRELLATRGNA